MMKSTKVFGRLKLIIGVTLLTFVSGTLGCNGASSSTPSASGDGKQNLGATSPLVSQSTVDCSTSLTDVTPNMVTGIIKFLDKDFDNTGFTGASVCRAVKFADVQIVRASDSSVLASGSTDSQGNYSISGLSFSGESVYVRALTSSIASNKKITVKADSSQALYSVVSNDFVFETGGVIKELSVPLGSSAARPFNVFSVLMDGALFVETITGAVLTTETIGFYPNSADDGTYFSAPNLFICGACSNDDDGWDDTVIMHEFGHFVANAYSLDHSAGGNHTLTGHFELPLTWSEGWATFFSSALRDFLGVANPEYYVDTNGTTGQFIGIAYEIETPAFPQDTVGADNEVAVSAALWDIYDSSNEPAFDTISGGIGNPSSGIWDVFQNYLPNTTFVTLEDFWEGWFIRGNGTLNGTGDITKIFEARKVFYREDDSEPDDTSATATLLQVGTPAITNRSPQNNRTFYPSLDKDWYRFTYLAGNTYTVQTLDLGDGADPVIELYSDPSQTTPLCSNDDISISPPSNVNARLTVPSPDCPVSGSGTLYLKVFSSTAPSNPAEYGNYNIKVTL